METLLSLENGAFKYGGKTVFSGLNLEVKKGQIFSILGANGCGKTTLLNCLNGTFKLYQGKICLGDRDISSMSVVEIARRMGFVFQEHSAPFPFSVFEVVRMGRAPHLGFFSLPSKKDNLAAEQALEMVGMTHLKNYPYTQISGGERQLVLIARTITQGTDIILMDEPTSHLDFKNQTLILRMINKLAAQGTAIIMSTHLPNHALLYSSQVALMSRGQFLLSGSPDSVISEKTLSDTYGIEVKILSLQDDSSGKPLRLVVPSI